MRVPGSVIDTLKSQYKRLNVLLLYHLGSNNEIIIRGIQGKLVEVAREVGASDEELKRFS